MDRLHSMRVFARVVDEGSFARAARELNLSAAVVTRLVADLEDHLGARLLNRTTRRLALTDVGELYLERVRQILTDIDEAEALASAALSDPRGQLRVTCPPAFATHQLAKHLPKFRQRFPRVTIELSIPGPVTTVDENADVSIIMIGGERLDGDFVARLLARSEAILCASPDYLARAGWPQHPQDLLDHESMFPVPTRDVTFRRRSQTEGGAEESVTLSTKSPALGTNHTDTMLSAARAGLGLTALPSFLMEDALNSGALVRVLPEWHVVTVSIYAAMPTRKHVPARTRAFMDFLLETFGGEDRDPWQRAAADGTQLPRAPWAGHNHVG